MNRYKNPWQKLIKKWSNGKTFTPQYSHVRAVNLSRENLPGVDFSDVDFYGENCDRRYADIFYITRFFFSTVILV